jgi:hypothetical protein
MRNVIIMSYRGYYARYQEKGASRYKMSHLLHLSKDWDKVNMAMGTSYGKDEDHGYNSIYDWGEV